MRTITWLALGDSYTIGEQVLLTDSFPYQTVKLLRQAAKTGDSKTAQLDFAAPEIIAITGFTTDELSAIIDQTVLLTGYDIVSLLIGVNNQYRGRSVDEFKTEFDHLLQIAIQSAKGDPAKVFVLSIPDWGITPFAAGKDHVKISADIDAYNAVCRNFADLYKCMFIDITADQRKDAANPDYLAADLLHPSGKEYTKWAAKLSTAIIESY